MFFNYLYRDAGNFKAWGELLLEGTLSDSAIASMREHFESGEYFIAEQIGVPVLYEQLWAECKSLPSDELDHVWHEFHTVRDATDEDCAKLTCWGSAQDLLERITATKAWKPALSRNWAL